MPRVPDTLPSVGYDPTPSGGFGAPRTVPQQNARGEQLAALGQAGLRASGVLFEAGQRQREQERLTRARERANLLTEATLKTVGQYRTLKGKEGVEGYQAAFDAVAQAREKLEAGLDDDTLELFKPAADKLLLDARVDMDAHRATSQRAWDVSEADTSWKANAATYGARFDTNPREAAEARERAIGYAEEWATLEGRGEAGVAAARLAATTAMHGMALDRLVGAGQATAARAYLEQHGGEIDPAEQERYARTVRTATVAAESTRLSMHWLDIAAKRGGTLEEQRDYAVAIADHTFRGVTTGGGKLSPEVRDEAIQRIDADYRRRKQSEAASDNGLVKQAIDALDANPMMAVSELPPDLRSELRERGLTDDVATYARQRRYTTSPKAFAEVMALPVDTLRSVSTAELVRRYRGRLDDGDLKLLLSRQAAALGKSSKSDEDALTKNQRIVEAFYRATKRNRGLKLGDSGEAELFRYREHVQRLIDLEGEVTSQRLQDILDTAAVDMVWRDDTWSGDDLVPAWQLSDDERRSAYVNVGGENVLLGDLPLDVHRLITRRLVEAGEQVSEARIMGEWVRAGRPKTLGEAQGR